MQQVAYLLTRLQGLGVEMFDFLRGTSQFKRDFTPFFIQQYDVYYSKNLIIRLWWRAAISFSQIIKGNETAYKLYLFIKGRVDNLGKLKYQHVILGKV